MEAKALKEAEDYNTAQLRKKDKQGGNEKKHLDRLKKLRHQKAEENFRQVQQRWRN